MDRVVVIWSIVLVSRAGGASELSGMLVENIDSWVPHQISQTLPLNKTHRRYMRILKFEGQQAHLYSS